MMTVAGAVFFFFSLVKWWVAGDSGDALFLSLPFLGACVVADAGAAAGAYGLQRITEAGEEAIIKARMSWRDRY
ncbi:hypothetical protein [Kerstersia gyiorum]|uniref:hypothetical protein n=1 Tax=Kerstersia gyiorum TaxID=206506 RepID=UPI00209D23C4|nr:hypothetical protein [Kerstersia gyiorum]MCP1680693.1 hypothetical protein [Kerstersia gyiorum]MCP1825227.1 hypothetical protein [Kerstersia gyiorum]MCP1828644.1 hypothetical protein [Kerstersia gyiorum]MCW2452268.1 hypothetical protein [Kerstersia gyiorum]